MPADYSKSPLVKKLAIKPKTRITVVNAPQGYGDLLGDLPPETRYSETFDGTFDWILLFVKTQSELDDQISGVKARLAPGGILWIAFPRAKQATDLSRNSMWPMQERYGLQVVSNAVVNDDWTAYRFKQS